MLFADARWLLYFSKEQAMESNVQAEVVGRGIDGDREMSRSLRKRDRDGRDRNSIDARAHRRVRRKMGFYIHALVFVIVNVGLFAINSITGEPRWSHFPLMGWGLGLAIHGIVTFISLQGEGIRRGMVAREVERLRQRDQR